MVPDVGREAHHQLFTDWIDRRVRHLSKQLLEVIEQRLRLVRKHGKRGIVTHGANRLCPVLGHRLQDDGKVFCRVAKTLLLHQNVVGNFGRVDFTKEPANAHLVFGNPAAVRLGAGHLRLHLRILQNTVVFQIQINDFAGFEAALFFHLVITQIQHARLGGHHEKAVFTQSVTRRTEAVAVENRTRIHAIAERHGGRTVPRFHKHRFVFEEPTHIATQVMLLAPSLRHEHHHRMRKATTRSDEKLKHVVQASRVTLPRRNQRQELLQVIADNFAFQLRLASAQAVQVTAQGIDFAVMSEVAERVRQRPRGERIRGVALVNKGNRALEIEIVQVLVETLNLAGQKQALIDDATAAAAANIKTLASLFHQATHHIQLNIKCAVIFKSGTVKEHLADMRQGLAGRAADLFGIHRHLAEIQHLHTLGSGNLLDFRVKGIRRKRILHKEHRHAVTRRQFRVQFAEKLVRHRKQETRTVAGFRVSTCCTAVHEPLQNGNALQHNLVRGNIINIGDQANTAGVVFVGRIVKCLSVHIYPFLVFYALFMQKPCQISAQPANY